MQGAHGIHSVSESGISANSSVLCSLHPPNLGPLHTQVKGCDHVLVRALGSHPKAMPLIQSAGICIKPIS